MLKYNAVTDRQTPAERHFVIQRNIVLMVCGKVAIAITYRGVNIVSRKRDCFPKMIINANICVPRLYSGKIVTVPEPDHPTIR